MKIKALTRDTNLGKLTVWFGDCAISYIEGVRSSPQLTGQVYAEDQLDRYLRGAQTDKDVFIYKHNRGHDDEKIAAGGEGCEPRRFVEPHPLAELTKKVPVTKGYGIDPTWFAQAKADCEADNSLVRGDRPESAPEYEPIGTLPVVGDEVCAPTGNRAYAPDCPATVVRLADEGLTVEFVSHIAGTEIDCVEIDVLVNAAGAWRILKRKAPEAEGWVHRDGVLRIIVGDETFRRIARGWIRASSPVVTKTHIAKLRDEYADANNEDIAIWLAEIREAGLL